MFCEGAKILIASGGLGGFIFIFLIFYSKESIF